MQPCAGKTALVTGASVGAGRAVALALAKAGAQVVMQHSRSSVVAEETVQLICVSGGKTIALTIDLASPGGPLELASRTREIVGDRLDILVFNARLSRSMDLRQATIKTFDAEYAAAIRAPLFLVQQLLPTMTQGSKFVLTLEAPAKSKLNPVSSSLMGGLAGLLGELSRYLEELGVAANAVVPEELARAPFCDFARISPKGLTDTRSSIPTKIAQTVKELVSE